jgi:hypothetical protein
MPAGAAVPAVAGAPRMTVTAGRECVLMLTAGPYARTVLIST